MYKHKNRGYGCLSGYLSLIPQPSFIVHKVFSTIAPDLRKAKSSSYVSDREVRSFGGEKDLSEAVWAMQAGTVRVMNRDRKILMRRTIVFSNWSA